MIEVQCAEIENMNVSGSSCAGTSSESLRSSKSIEDNGSPEHAEKVCIIFRKNQLRETYGCTVTMVSFCTNNDMRITLSM